MDLLEIREKINERLRIYADSSPVNDTMNRLMTLRLLSEISDDLGRVAAAVEKIADRDS